MICLRISWPWILNYISRSALLVTDIVIALRRIYLRNMWNALIIFAVIFIESYKDSISLLLLFVVTIYLSTQWSSLHCWNIF